MKHIFLVMLSSFLFAQTALSKDLPRLREFVETNITEIENTLNNDETKPDKEKRLQIQKFRLRLKGEFGIDVAFIAKFVLVPSIELHWKKEAR